MDWDIEYAQHETHKDLFVKGDALMNMEAAVYKLNELEAQLEEAKKLLLETVKYTPDHMDLREWKARRDRLIKGIK